MFTKLTERYSISLLIFNWDEIHRTKDLRILKCTVQWHFVHSWCLLPPPLSTPESFHSPQRKPGNPQAVTPDYPLPPAPGTTNLHSLSVDLPILDFSYKWNHTVCDSLCLDCNVWIYHALFISLLFDGHLDCSYLSAVVTRTFVYKHLFGYQFSVLLGMCLGMELPGHMIIVCLTFGVWYSWIGASLLAPMIKNLPAVWETWVQSLGQEGTLEKGMATHSSVLAWRILWTEEPGRSFGSQRVRHDWATNSFTFLGLGSRDGCTIMWVC